MPLRRPRPTACSANSARRCPSAQSPTLCDRPISGLACAGVLLAGALACAPAAPELGDGDAGTHPAGSHDAGSHDAGPDAGSATEMPTAYAFANRFSATGESSVFYTGQTARHLLIQHLTRYISTLDDTRFAGSSAADVRARLEFYYDFKNQGGADTDAHTLTLAGEGVPLQSTYGDVGGLVSLKEKIAGNDDPYPHGVIGIGAGTQTPDEVMDSLLDELAELVIARSARGEIPQDPAGQDIAKPHVTASGRDLAQLIQKFVTGALAYNQAADDYLDDDKQGKGLLSDNTTGERYTNLEHAWDEAFGYFGAARDFGDYTDDEIAGAGGRDAYRYGYFDSNGDGRIDLGSEVNLGHATNAAKRDRGSAGTSAPTDYTEQAFRAFLEGRHLIATRGALDEADLAALRALRDEALDAWERTLAASALHYANETLQDMARFGTPCADASATDCYRFTDHAKHWSELKGFAWALQFNPHARISLETLSALHEKIGEAPVLPGAAPEVIEAYRVALREARGLLQEAFDFDSALVGDDNGKGGF